MVGQLSECGAYEHHDHATGMAALQSPESACESIVRQVQLVQRCAALERLEPACELIVCEVQLGQRCAAPERLEAACQMIVGQREHR